MRTAFEAMGTVVSLDLNAPQRERELTREVAAVFEASEGKYSLYRPDSELSLIASGRLPLTGGSKTLLDCYARALDWQTGTEGAFTPHRPDGVIDLNGIVKAEAIAAAGARLDELGCREWTINAGGDILACGAPRDGRAWGVSDPQDPPALLCSVVVKLPRRAMATSGSAQRGDHIWRTETGSTAFVQATVIADGIVAADIIATAIIAGGRRTLDMVTDRWDVDVLTVDGDGAMLATPGFRRALAAPVPSPTSRHVGRPPHRR